MTHADIAFGATCVSRQSLTDDELINAIKATGLALTYCRARGEYFGLVSTCLTRDLEMLKGFARSRKLQVESGVSD